MDGIYERLEKAQANGMSVAFPRENTQNGPDVSLNPHLDSAGDAERASADHFSTGRVESGAPTTGTPAAQEMRAIRQLLEQQTRQLETLTQQVAKLNQMVESSHSIAPLPSPAAQDMPPSSAQEPNPAAAGTPEPPRAELPDIGTTHIVTRGETLTSIAKQYKVTISELQKENKIQNDRKLQIGQTLTIPSPKSMDPHKKEKQ